MLSRILVAASVTLLSLPAYCQTPPAKQAKTIPDYILYDRFLYRVAWFEKQADELKAQGKKDTFMRSWIRVHGGLSPREESYLKEMAASCQVRTASIATAAKEILASGAGASKAPQLDALMAQREQVVTEHMGRINAAFGAARFALLQQFARKIVQFDKGTGTVPASAETNKGGPDK